MKNMRKLLCILLAIFMVFCLFGCNKNKMYETSFTDVFDTFVQICGYHQSEREFVKISNETAQFLREYHKLYDIYNDYEGINNIKTINDNAGISPVKVDSRIIDLLKFCKEAYYLTDGNVNVAMGSVLKLWHDSREQAQATVYPSLPDMSLLQEAAKHMDIESMVIDEENSTVYLSDKDARLDVGAVAKGYATEKASEFLAARGIVSGFISVGGNVKVMGEPLDGSGGWTVGIQNPDAQYADKPLTIISANRGALVSSGDYQRFFTVDGVKYHHIIDKDTLMPTVGMRGVSVWVEDSGMADVLSTYFFTISYEEALEFISDHPELNIKAYWVLSDGTQHYTEGLDEYMVK